MAWLRSSLTSDQLVTPPMRGRLLTTTRYLSRLALIASRSARHSAPASCVSAAAMVFSRVAVCAATSPVSGRYSPRYL